MEDYILIVVAMKAAVDENTMEREIEKLTEVLDSCARLAF